MKDVKENPVQWTDWDSNRECLKFDKVVKHTSSTEIITANKSIHHIRKMHCQHFTLKHITLSYQIL